jgi:hypothetical protein
LNSPYFQVAKSHPPECEPLREQLNFCRQQFVHFIFVVSSVFFVFIICSSILDLESVATEETVVIIPFQWRSSILTSALARENSARPGGLQKRHQVNQMKVSQNETLKKLLLIVGNT